MIFLGIGEKYVNSLAKEHVCINQRLIQQCADARGTWGRTGGGKNKEERNVQSGKKKKKLYTMQQKLQVKQTFGTYVTYDSMI